MAEMTERMLAVWQTLTADNQAKALAYMGAASRTVDAAEVRCQPTSVTILDAGQLTPDLYTRFVRSVDAMPKTVETYTRNLRLFVEWMEPRGITHPTRETILQYKQQLQADGLRPTTVTNRLNAVKAFFRWTEIEGLYPDITQHVKGGKISTEHKRDALTEDQLKHILASIDRTALTGKRDYAIIVLAATTGLRTCELSAARIADLRPRGGQTVLYIKGKGHDDADTPRQVYPEAERAIRDWLAARGKASETDPLFVSTSNRCRDRTQPLSPEDISKIIKRRFRAAGYDSSSLTAHSLRHSFVTIAAQHGEKMEDVQQAARHARLDTTAIYYHELDVADNSCVRTVGDALFKAS